MAGAEAGIAEVDLDKTFDLLPLVLEAVENAENPENFSKLVSCPTRARWWGLLKRPATLHAA